MVSSEGAHSSREGSEYFKLRTGAEVKVTVVPEVETSDVVEMDRDAEGSLVMSEVERKPAECNCAPAVPVLAEDVIMCLEDVLPRLLSVDEDAPLLYLASCQCCVQSASQIHSSFRHPYSLGAEGVIPGR